PNPVAVLLGLFFLMSAFGRFKAYRQLRLLFAERPSPEHIAWFDELTAEIRAADPQADEHAVDLSPHWRAKLLGSTSFFVAARGTSVGVVGTGEFELLRERADHGTGRRKALLRIHGLQSPEFEIGDASWANYQRWRAAHPLTEPVA